MSRPPDLYDLDFTMRALLARENAAADVKARACRLCGAGVDDSAWRTICRLHFDLEPELDAGYRTCAKCIRTAREQRPKPRPAPLREPLGLRIERGGYEG